jgi:serine/threonine-protein kinase
VRESEADRRGPVPVSAVPEDESPYGIRGLVGNVADWCGDRFNSEGPAITPDGRLDRSGLLVSAPPGARLNFRGGTWVFHASRCSLDARWSWEATGRRPDLSFRLVSSPQGGPA